MSKLELALQWAIVEHSGQTDKAGVPYIFHCLSVWNRVRFSPENTQIVAILHDIVEDTKVTVGEVRVRFGDTVADAVDALTRREQETYFDGYIQRLSKNPIAKEVKKADLQDNMMPERLLSLPESQRGVRKRYAKAYNFLL